MDWEHEWWVKLYRRNSPTFAMLPWQARGLFRLLLTEANHDTGMIELDPRGRMGPRALQALAAAINAPFAEVKDFIQDLLDDGCVEIIGNYEYLHIVNYLDAQGAKSTSAARMKRHRERQKRSRFTPSVPGSDEMDPSDDVTEASLSSDGSVTKSDGSVTPPRSTRTRQEGGEVYPIQGETGKSTYQGVTDPSRSCDGSVTKCDGSDQSREEQTEIPDRSAKAGCARIASQDSHVRCDETGPGEPHRTPEPTTPPASTGPVSKTTESEQRGRDGSEPEQLPLLGMEPPASVTKPDKPQSKKRRQRDPEDPDLPTRPSADDLKAFWGEFRNRWKEAYGSPYAQNGQDSSAMVELILTAYQVARDSEHKGHAGAVELWKHWVRCYLADSGYNGFLSKRHHALAHMPREINGYRTPWVNGGSGGESAFAAAARKAGGSYFGSNVSEDEGGDE